MSSVQGENKLGRKDEQERHCKVIKCLITLLVAPGLNIFFLFVLHSSVSFEKRVLLLHKVMNKWLRWKVPFSYVKPTEGL